MYFSSYQTHILWHWKRVKDHLKLSSETLDKDRVCRPQTTCTDGRIPVLDQAEGAVCGCPPGKEEVAGSCELLFSQSVCKEGQVLMPETQAVGSKTCSAGFSCRQAKDCEAFTVAKSMMGKKGTRRREEQSTFLKEMTCNKKTKSICCRHPKPGAGPGLGRMEG